MSKHKIAGTPGLDPTLPDVRLEIGSDTFQLCFDFAALVVAENQTGLNLLTAVARDVNAGQLQGLLYAALLKHQPDVTLDKVAKLIRPTTILQVHAAIFAAWFGSVGADEDGGSSTGEPKAQTQHIEA